MSDATTMDIERAVSEVRAVYGHYSLLNLKQNPSKVALVVATVLDIHPGKAVGCPRPKGLFLAPAVAEIVDYLARADEPEPAWVPLDVIEEPAVSQGADLHHRPSTTAAERLADDAAERHGTMIIDESAPFTEADFDKVVGRGDGLDALALTDLRKLSKGGVVTGGYSMKKPDLIAALRSAGVRA